MPDEYEIKINVYGEKYYASKLISCVSCGTNTYLSGMTIKYHIEHHLPIQKLCCDCATKKFMEAHEKKY